MEMGVTTRLAHREGFRLTAEAFGRGRRGGGLQVETHTHLRNLAVAPVMAEPGEPGLEGPALVAAAQTEAACTGAEGGRGLVSPPVASAIVQDRGTASEMPPSCDGGMPQRAEGMQPTAVRTPAQVDSAAPSGSGAVMGIGRPAPETGRMRVLVRALEAPGAGPQGQDVHWLLGAGAAGEDAMPAGAEGTSAPPEGVRGAGVAGEQPQRERVREVGLEEMLARLARRERLEFAR
jgi:hypothetical protein